MSLVVRCGAISLLIRKAAPKATSLMDAALRGSSPKLGRGDLRRAARLPKLPFGRCHLSRNLAGARIEVGSDRRLAGHRHEDFLFVESQRRTPADAIGDAAGEGDRDDGFEAKKLYGPSAAMSVDVSKGPAVAPTA